MRLPRLWPFSLFQGRQAVQTDGDDLPRVLRFSARLYAGDPIKVEFEDLGLSFSAYDVSGNAFEAYTSRWTIDGSECFNRTYRYLADQFSNAAPFRMAEDRAFLQRLGVNPDSLTDECGERPFAAISLLVRKLA